MKSISIVSFAICLLAFTTGCQQEEVAPLKVGEPSLVQGGEFTPVVHHRSIPPDQEIRTDYRGATKWRITFNEPNQYFPYTLDYQRFFSTTNGSFYTLHELNNSAKATSRIDLDFLYGSLQSPTEYAVMPYPNHPEIHLQYPESSRNTLFKPSDMSPEMLASITILKPNQLMTEFERNSSWPAPYQPYSDDGNEPPGYEIGEIYLFKTDRNPVRYGAVHIIDRYDYFGESKNYVIEITVQTGNTTATYRNSLIGKQTNFSKQN